MGIEEIERVKEAFSKLNLHPTYLKHKAVITSEDAANTRGFELRQGIKAIIITNGKDNWAVVDIPADQKVDLKKVATQLAWSKSSIRFATSEEVLGRTGCEIGAVPPFGHKNKIQILVDKGVYDNKESTFNIGLRTNSVKILTEEMKIVFAKEDVVEGDFIKI